MNLLDTYSLCIYCVSGIVVNVWNMSINKDHYAQRAFSLWQRHTVVSKLNASTSHQCCGKGNSGQEKRSEAGGWL